MIIPIWVKVAVFAGLVVLCKLWIDHRDAGIYKAGGDAARVSMAADYAKQKSVADAKWEVKISDLRNAIVEADTRRFETEAKYDELQKTRAAAARTGTISMSVPTTKPDAVCRSETGTGPAVAAVPGQTERASLLPETVVDVLDVAAGNARDVRDYNDLLARYRQLETYCADSTSAITPTTGKSITAQ